MTPVETATILNPDTDNLAFMKAVSFVNETDENLFLTGKAGAGKTTFLKYIRATTKKKTAVLAPTGIAAINAGGETIHSFLQLPLSPFIPESIGGFGRNNSELAIDRHSLLQNLKLRDSKLSLIRKLELLIIDEVSMVRADIMDAIDTVLRHVRRRHDVPFGGIQVIFIGDLFQLPPVIRDEEWQVLGQYYRGTFFFNSRVIQQNMPLYIELNKIYRQKDSTFIAMLNRIRTGLTTPEDISTLNQRISVENPEGYIILCTHNQIADEINLKELKKLDSPLHVFEGKVNNDFNVRNVTVEMKLELKKGAQVMFVKNDLQVPRRYYNGKIAVVHSITDDGIKVTFPNEPKTPPIFVNTEIWRNVRYAYDMTKGEVVEEEVGSFEQYPLRLAWAITVHKSQGLTLDKAIVDLNRSFATGQVYVALSRCTSMEGLLLRSPLALENVMVDERAIDFVEHCNDESELDQILEVCRKRAKLKKVSTVYDFEDLLEATTDHAQNIEKRKLGPTEENRTLYNNLLNTWHKEQKHAENFQKLMAQLYHAGDDQKIKERMEAASLYFVGKVLDPAIASIEEHLTLYDTSARLTRQIKLWKTLKNTIGQKISDMNSLL